MDPSALKLVYISRAYTTHDRRFLSAFVDAGFDVLHLRLLGDNLDTRVVPAGVRTLHWVGESRPYDSVADFVDRWVALESLLRETRPDVVIAGPIQTSAFLVASVGFKPCIAMAWGSDMLVDAEHDDMKRQVTRFTLQHASGAIGDCLAVRDAIGKYNSIPDDRALFFPWGIDTTEFAPREPRSDLRRRLGWADKTVLISNRSWEPLYALDVLVEAFACAVKRRKDLRLMLLGDGSQKDLIHARIEELGLSPFLHAPGRINNDAMSNYLNSADVYVSTALSDGTSVSLLEAMGCGLPVIVSDGFGNTEWVKAGVNGWVVRPGDKDQLVNAVGEASGCSNLKAIGKVNRETVCRKADWKQNVPALCDMIVRIARGSRQ